ncbi:hypothetical protein [Kitasatospora sp. NPDC094015]|uniref:hypothetical protein n=1 Tax=Kitasatospora sp. NPDC094015 TaxID=3155205 RepID=UPI003320283E
MSDTYEMTLSVLLPSGVGAGELAELQWQLGQADHRCGAAAEPLLADCGALGEAGDGWAVTAHREIRADEFPALDTLLVGLARLSGVQGPLVVGQLRRPGDGAAEPLVVRRGAVEWPSGAAAQER